MAEILVVDDDPQMRDDIAEMLRSEGYNITTASSGEEALEFIRERDFDVVLTDLMMPGISGMDVLREVMKIKPKTRVIVITAFATIESAVEAMKIGASDYISKPFKLNEVQVAVRRALEEAKFSERLSTSKESSIQEIASSLSNPIRRAAIEYLLLQGKSSFMGIFEELGVGDHTKLSFHLRKLKEAGIVQQDSKKKYTLSEKGRKVAEALKTLEKIA
jgi:DNA-binding NtrC family response regulator